MRARESCSCAASASTSAASLMTTARDGRRDALAASAPACLPAGGRDDFGCGRRDGLRSDLAALRFIDVEFPKRESQREDSACPDPAQRPPPPPPDRLNRLSYKALKACGGMSQASRDLQKPDRLRPRVVEYRRRQWAAEHGAGVEVQPIGAQIGHAVGQRRMAVHDQTAVVAAMGQERLPDPQQVEVVLRLERRAGIDAGMDEKAPAVVIAQGQRAQPIEVGARQLARLRDTIAFERRQAALRQPQPHRAAAVDGRERHRFVVSHQRHDALAMTRFQIDQTIDDAARLRSAIDVVADKYECRRPAAGVHFATQQEAAQLVQTAVNIADGIGERHDRRWLFNDGDIQAYPFRPHSPKNGNLGALGAIGVLRRTHAVEVNIMRKILTALVAATAIAAAAVATSGTAEAQWHGGWHGGWGWGPGPFIGGLAAGALIGGALAAPYAYPYPYGYYAGYYAPPPYAGPCVWRRVWNGYGWVRACV